MEFLQGKKTYTGIAVLLLGSFGIFSYVSESDLTTTLNTIMTLVGIGTLYIVIKLAGL